MKISIYVILGLLQVFASKQEPYECHGDVCNAFSGMEPQFCSSVFQMCRDCKDVILDCQTSKQPRNCSEYCEANLCTDVERMLTIANGNATAQQYNGKSMTVGSDIIYGCNACYVLDGSAKITCLGNNTWSEKSVPVCFHRSQLDIAIKQAFESKKMEEGKTCFVLPMMTYLSNGDVIAPEFNDSRVPVGTVLQYRCNNGYSLKGPVTLKCLGNDTWSDIETPYCFEDTWRGYKYGAIGLIFFCTCTCFLASFLLLKLCRHSRRENEQEISRDSSSASFPKEELIPFISKSEDQTFHTEDEQRAFKRDDVEKLIKSPAVTSPPRPSAPPAVEEPQHDNKIGQQNNINNNSSVNNQTGLLVNIHLINNVNGHRQPEPDGKSAENPREGANQNRESNRKGIDVKMSTEISNETDATEESDETEAVKETASDAKSRGTKPLPARGQKTAGAQEDMSKGNEAMGPKAVPAKDESVQLPTKETGQDIPPGKLGFNDATFQSTDAERSEMRADVAEYPNEVGSTHKLDELKEGIGTNA